jgi:hypothetical protein
LTGDLGRQHGRLLPRDFFKRGPDLAESTGRDMLLKNIQKLEIADLDKLSQRELAALSNEIGSSAEGSRQVLRCRLETIKMFIPPQIGLHHFKNIYKLVKVDLDTLTQRELATLSNEIGASAEGDRPALLCRLQTIQMFIPKIKRTKCYAILVQSERPAAFFAEIAREKKIVITRIATLNAKIGSVQFHIIEFRDFNNYVSAGCLCDCPMVSLQFRGGRFWRIETSFAEPKLLMPKIEATNLNASAEIISGNELSTYEIDELREAIHDLITGGKLCQLKCYKLHKNRHNIFPEIAEISNAIRLEELENSVRIIYGEELLFTAHFKIAEENDAFEAVRSNKPLGSRDNDSRNSWIQIPDEVYREICISRLIVQLLCSRRTRVQARKGVLRLG